MKIWSCKIGESDAVPHGGDLPMREAVGEAYRKVTGQDPQFLFSGWGADLDERERAVVENRLPREPANMPNPTEADLADPMFEAIWQATKTWDVNAPEYYTGYCGLNGSHVMLILDAIRKQQAALSA